MKNKSTVFGSKGIFFFCAIALAAVGLELTGCPTEEEDTGGGGGGAFWTLVDDSKFDSGVYGIAWGGASGSEKFVAVGDGSVLAYSPDGETWTEVSDSKPFYGIAWGGGRFVAVGYDIMRIPTNTGVNP